jgi:predicted enzyme related to lactoylglutathione lyase
MPPPLALVIDCADPDRLAEFWAAALGYRPLGQAGPYRSLVPADGSPGPKLILQGVSEGKVAKNRMHLDIHTADVDAEVERLIALGGRRADSPAIEEHGTRWVVMGDPEGNEFCVCREGS